MMNQADFLELGTDQFLTVFVDLESWVCSKMSSLFVQDLKKDQNIVYYAMQKELGHWNDRSGMHCFVCLATCCEVNTRPSRSVAWDRNGSRMTLKLHAPFRLVEDGTLARHIDIFNILQSRQSLGQTFGIFQGNTIALLKLLTRCMWGRLDWQWEEQRFHKHAFWWSLKLVPWILSDRREQHMMGELHVLKINWQILNLLEHGLIPLRNHWNNFRDA